MGISADEIVSKVLARCFWPATNAPLSSAEILSLADEKISGELWPKIIASGGDYYVSSVDHPITADFSRYRQPNRMFGPVKDVLFVDDDGAEFSIPMIGLEELGRPEQIGGSRSGFFHYVEGDFIGLYPVPDVTGGTLRIRYYRYPNVLCLLAAARRIDSIVSLSSGIIATDSSADALWDTGDELDIISDGNAHQVLFEAGVVSSFPIAAQIDFSTTLTGAGVQAGDYVATTGQTPIAQIPDHMIAVLVRLVAQAALEDQADYEAAARQERSAKSLQDKAQSVSVPRSEAEPQTIVTRNSPLRAMRSGRW